jgi:hypothetical protein
MAVTIRNQSKPHFTLWVAPKDASPMFTINIDSRAAVVNLWETRRFTMSTVADSLLFVSLFSGHVLE